jgi:mannose-6-phosphate isomerase
MLSTWQYFGGNQVLALGAEANASITFAERPYSYRLVHLRAEQEELLEGLGSVTIFCLDAPMGASAVVDGDAVLQAGDSVCVEGHKTVSIRCRGGIVVLLATGVAESQVTAPTKRITRAVDQYKVVKPWGHELWINGQHPGYALKEIFIKRGTCTSLQYHNIKEETNVLFRGQATLVYRSNDAVPNDAVQTKDLGEESLRPLAVLHVKSGVLHRLIAQTDVLLYESSTPYLDDVVRVQDSTSRPDGRIAAEHRQ